MSFSIKTLVKQNLLPYRRVYLVASFLYFKLCRLFGVIWFRRAESVSVIESIGSDGYESFKGYYDISPENGDGLIFVYETRDSTIQEPRNYNCIMISIFRSSNLRQSIASRSTKAFNWQQGSRAYWVDDRRLIYNDYCEKTDTYVAKLWDVIEDVIERTFALPVEAPIDHRRYISVNFKRLAEMRPDYGYFAHLELGALEFDDDTDGFWIVDIDSGESLLWYSMTDIISSSNLKFPEGLDTS